MDDVSNFCPAMAVPITVKMPEPITAPMPRAVSEIGPSVFLSLRSGSSESEISLSMDLQQKSWFSEVRTVVSDGPEVGCGKRSLSPEIVGPTHQHRHLAGKRQKCTLIGQAPTAKCQLLLLPLRRASHQLLHLALLRSASVLAGLQWILGFALLTRRAFCFFAFVFA